MPRLFAADHNDPNAINSIFFQTQANPADLYDLYGFPTDAVGPENVVIALTFASLPDTGVFDTDLLYRILIAPNPRPARQLEEKATLDSYLSYFEAVRRKYFNLNPAEVRVTVDESHHARIQFLRFPGGSYSKVIETNKAEFFELGGHAIKMFVGVEWGVNLVQSSTQFNLSAAGPGDFGQVTTTNTSPFNARLGFAGIDFGPAGRVAIGKENSVHYDVTSYTTDRFNVFGGQGTSTYVAGTDGGASGTGRADRVVNYRNKIFNIIDIGFQGQFRGADANGVGASGQVTILPGVKVGAAFTHTNWPQSTRNAVRGLGENADYAAVGTHINWDFLEVGFVYSHQTSGDMVQVPVGTVNRNVAFDANGEELYVRAGLGPIGIIGGFTNQSPDRRDPLLNPNFKTSYIILGGEWLVVQRAKVYTESKIDLDTVSATGVAGGSVFTIGFRYDFSWQISHK